MVNKFAVSKGIIMKNKKWIVFTILCVMWIVMLSGCDNKKIETALKEIKSASKVTAKVTKGEFEFTYQIDDGDENAKKASQKVVGIFAVKEDEKVDWTRKIYIADEDVPRAEQKQENGTQYQKIMENEEWIPMNENAISYPPEMEGMMKISWKEKDIKKVDIIEKDGTTNYKLEFNDEFLNKLKEKEISAIEEELKIAKKENEEEYIKGLESSIEDYKAINYSEYKVDIIKGQGGEIVSLKTEITTIDNSQENQQNSTVITEVKIKNY